MDKGIWAAWYDVDADLRADFLDWMHRDYLPRLAASGHLAWVAHYQSQAAGEATEQLKASVLRRPDEDVGSGTQFLLIAGATSPHAFFESGVAEGLSGGKDAMLSRRKGVRMAIFVEEARVVGPEGEGAEMITGPVIQFGNFRIRSVEEEFLAAEWYAKTRLPIMRSTAGCIRARKLVCVAGWVKHGILYEFISPESRIENFEKPQEAKALNPERHWSVAKVSIHAPGSPTVAARTWPASLSGAERSAVGRAQPTF